MQIRLHRLGTAEQSCVGLVIDSYANLPVTLFDLHLRQQRRAKKQQKTVGPFHGSNYIISVAWTSSEGVTYSERAATGTRGLLRQFCEWLDSGHRTSDELIALCLER